MGNAQGKGVPRTGDVSREHNGEIQESNEADKVPVRDETEHVQLASAEGEDHEVGDVGKDHHCELKVSTSPYTCKPTVPPKALHKTPSPNVHHESRSEDCQDTPTSIPTGSTIELQCHSLEPTGQGMKVPNGTLAHSDATAQRPGDSKSSRNVNHVFKEGRPRGDCPGALQSKATTTYTSESTALGREAEQSDTSYSTEATSELKRLSSVSAQTASTFSSPSGQSPPVNIRGSPGSPSSSSSTTRQAPAEKCQKAWGARMLRFFASYSTDDVALGADAFRAPEMLDQPPPQSFRYQVNDEDSLRARSQRIPCQPNCVFCRSAISEVVEKDEGARKTAEASTAGPVDDSTSSNSSFPSSMRKDASQQIARKAAAVSLAPERTLNPRPLEHCTWKIPPSKRERRRARMETSASSERTLVRRTSIPSRTQVLDSRSNAFDEQLRASDSSEVGATLHVLSVLRQLLQRSGIPSQTAVSLLDEWPVHMNSNGIPLGMPGSDRVVIREIIEDPARTRLLLRNMFRLMERLAASGRSLLSFERADEQLYSLMQRCSSVHENDQLQHRLQALPCGSEGSERAEPQTFLSPQQVDNFEKEVHSFLQHVQQFSEQAQLFYQQARLFVADFKAFQLRMEHFKQGIDNIAQAVPISEARVDTHAPGEQDAHVLSLEELLGGFPFIEGFTRLIQSFSQRIFSTVQVTEASAATEGTHQPTARESSEERQATQGSPQRDGNSRRNVANAPTSRCSERSHLCSSPGDGDVVNAADKQVHCVFIKAFGNPGRDREGVTKQVHTDPTENGDVTPCAEKSTITTSRSRASRNLWSPTGTTGKVTPSVFVFPPVASESTCSSEGSSPGPHLEESGHRSSQNLLEHPSKSGEPQFPPDDSEGIVKSSSSHERETSPEDAQFSKDDYPPSPNALVKLWRSFSFVRKLSTKDETPQSG